MLRGPRDSFVAIIMFCASARFDGNRGLAFSVGCSLGIGEGQKSLRQHYLEQVQRVFRGPNAELSAFVRWIPDWLAPLTPFSLGFGDLCVKLSSADCG